MEEKPSIVVTTRSRREAPAAREFLFDSTLLDFEGPQKVIRKSAWNEYKRLPIPTTRDDAWKRTDLRKLPVELFKLPEGEPTQTDINVPKELLRPMAGNKQGGQIVIAGENSTVQLAKKWLEKGVIFTDLKTAEKSYPELVSKLACATVQSQEGKFAALAAAIAQSGVILYVPKGVKIDQPLHSIFWASGKNTVNASHLMIWIDDGASVTYVHESASENNLQNMHAGLVEINVSDGASLGFVELQSWGDQVWNFTHERAQVGRDASIDWIFGSIGSHLTKNFTSLDLVAPGATGKMSGFYFGNNDQHLDHDTRQNHLAEHTTSDLLFKGALKGNSHSVWQGMIYVAPGAQKTDGYQANRNLILSPSSRADSIPGLEILADDVRCTHGATVGKIDPEPLFYLLSRGIPEGEAERLIVEGFFDPIMQRIPFEGVRERFQLAIMEKMKAS